MKHNSELEFKFSEKEKESQLLGVKSSYKGVQDLQDKLENIALKAVSRQNF